MTDSEKIKKLASEKPANADYCYIESMDEETAYVMRKFKEKDSEEIIVIKKDELKIQIINNPLLNNRQLFEETIYLVEMIITEGSTGMLKSKYIPAFIVCKWIEDLFDIQGKETEFAQEVEPIVMRYFKEDEEILEAYQNLTYMDYLEMEEEDSSEEFTLFNKEKFEALYNQMDPKNEHYKTIQNIKDKLTGSPVWAEYTQDFITKMEEVFSSYPNFSELKNIIIPGKAFLSLKKDNKISFSNVLIYGEPGCGKTSLLQKLCDLYKYSERISMGNGNSCIALSGSDKKYSPSDCGTILKSMMSRGSGPIGNPLVILDELDKTNFTDRGDSDFSGTFAELLEKNNAKHFTDNFFEVDVDASRINYIATANDISKIPDFILSRFPIKIKIRQYTPEELKSTVIINQYNDWINKNCMDRAKLPQTIEESTKDLIIECSHNHPREIENVLTEIAKLTVREDHSVPYADFKPTEDERHKLMNMFQPETIECHRMGFRA